MFNTKTRSKSAKRDCDKRIVRLRVYREGLSLNERMQLLSAALLHFVKAVEPYYRVVNVEPMEGVADIEVFRVPKYVPNNGTVKITIRRPDDE